MYRPAMRLKVGDIIKCDGDWNEIRSIHVDEQGILFQFFSGYTNITHINHDDFVETKMNLKDE
jgi:hypothetical protein